MKFQRESGILMHPTSLPSQYGIGDLGKTAFEFVDFLHQSKQKIWQMLPLGPVGYGESPYQSFSAFAGNILLISIDVLKEEGLLKESDLLNPPMFNPKKVQFKEVKLYKEEIFRKAYKAFKQIEKPIGYNEFVNGNSKWLEDFILFMAIKTRFGFKSWSEWDLDIKERRPEAIDYYTKELNDEIRYQEFLQYYFFKQWKALKSYANNKGIKIVGDLPIFISNDSSDAWARRELFEIDEIGNPIKVAGVPPDLFSATGQYWGNPHYRWDVMEKDEYRWWRDRFEMLMDMVDIIRIDHFRGFEAYWEIDGREKTAERGRWVKAPGAKLFKTIEKYLGKLPIIVEDLGFITEEVEKLKNEFEFPGMKILQFSFGRGSEERFLPHHYEENSVVYTGTHDNDTIVGWLESSIIEQPEAIESMKDYFGVSDYITLNDMCWVLIEVAFKCTSNTAIIPMQDILCISTEARMNIPSTIGGNWDWRFEGKEITPQMITKLQELSTKYNRNNC
ncbi:MAG: 4-alpha-glucanotransferase [Clostridia bacterium]|jgi:4-alpha-glucanotransferase|nr:4-alpha-glucanotransferase [Clostridia bacterium]